MILKVLKGLGIMLFLFFFVSEVTSVVVTLEHDYVRTAYAKEITVDGYQMFYRESGEDHEETILLIHGWLGSSYDYIRVLEALDDQYHVVAPDLMGFGLSEKSLTFDYAKANQASQLAKFLDALNLENVIVMGHSMGGDIAIHLAADFPLLVRQLILISPAVIASEGSGGPNAPAPDFFYDWILNNYYLQKAFFMTAYSSFEVEYELVTYDFYDEMYIVNKTIPGSVMREWTLDNDSGAGEAKLAFITQPVNLIWGTDDGFVPYEHADMIQDKLIAAEAVQIYTMNQAGHLPFDTFFESFMMNVEEGLMLK
jgi:pimeloyl-ACP methyl ester carboxylesterase